MVHGQAIGIPFRRRKGEQAPPPPKEVAWNPTIESNLPYKEVKYFKFVEGAGWQALNIGEILPVGQRVMIRIVTTEPYYEVSKAVSSQMTGIQIGKNGVSEYDIAGVLTVYSPQILTVTIGIDKNYVQWNPVVESNVPYKSIRYYKLGDSGSGWMKINIGDYITIGRTIMITIDTVNTVDELVSAVSSQLTGIGINGSNGTYNITGTLTSESPQNINITIDEYIRYEDIVQPYPILLRFNDENGNEVSWGGKFKVGSTITRIGSVADPESNLLSGLYSISGLSLNGKAVTSSTSIVEKQMVFRTTATWLLDNNEPKVILSPSRLRIPNSSYKLLGYIPDISGHGNHGVIHNSAYAEGSGVNEDGSYQFDGVDDFITIPTTVGGKQVLMKVNWQSSIGQGMLYDQRGTAFAIWNSDKYNDDETDTIPAYSARNGGNTYIDGILNKNILARQLRNITHNIVATNTMLNGSSVSPTIGCRTEHDAYFTNMSLYDFMLFDEISTDDKIKELNEYMGIAGGYVEKPEYYWDCFGKTNDDPDRDAITEQVSKDVANALSVKNADFKLDSGFGKYEVDFLDTSIWHSSNSTITSSKIDCKNAISHIMLLYYNVGDKEYPDIPSFKIIKTGADIDYSYIDETGFPRSVRIVDGVNVLPASHNTLYSGSGRFCGFGNPGIGNSVTITQIPEYQNGFVFNGKTAYLENLNILAITDFTAIAKRVWANKDNPMNECFIHKGVVSTPISESAFMLEYEITNDTYYRSASFGGYINVERVNRPENITYQTTESYNGIPIIKGSGIDTKGLVIGAVTNNYWKGIFYKLMLYSKTIDMLSINALKNLFALDILIDINHPIFKK